MVAVLVLGCTAFSACADAQGSPSRAAAPTPAPTTAALAEAENYRLAAGDAIRVTVFQNPEMTVETRVSEDGSVNYPLVGAIRLGGLDIVSAERKIAAALQSGGYLRKPQVNIELLRILGNKVSVLGQVNKPGSFPLETANTRISQVLADAGGLAPMGADTVILSGVRDQKPFRREIDVDALYRLNEPELDVPVAAGDTVYVPRAPTFYIYGEINKPGNYRVARDLTMRQAIAEGGGLTSRGTERRLRVVRKNAQGVPEKVDADLSERVRPDDVIYVNESIF